jgi:hypothetical protein
MFADTIGKLGENRKVFEVKSTKSARIEQRASG